MLEEKILSDYKEAMKKRDSEKSSTLSFLRAQFMNAALEKKKSGLDDAECIAVIKKLVKQHQDSIEQFLKGARQELADKEKAQMEILKSYLPQELGEEELKVMVSDTVRELSASGLKDMGRVMKEVMLKAAGRADNKVVSELVKKSLGEAKP